MIAEPHVEERMLEWPFSCGGGSEPEARPGWKSVEHLGFPTRSRAEEAWGRREFPFIVLGPLCVRVSAALAVAASFILFRSKFGVTNEGNNPSYEHGLPTVPSFTNSLPISSYKITVKQHFSNLGERERERPANLDDFIYLNNNKSYGKITAELTS